MFRPRHLVSVRFFFFLDFRQPKAMGAPSADVFRSELEAAQTHEDLEADELECLLCKVTLASCASLAEH